MAEFPSTYYQVTFHGGIQEISEADYQQLGVLLDTELSKWFTCSNIYGGEFRIRVDQITGIHQTTPETRSRWQQLRQLERKALEEEFPEGLIEDE